MSLLSRQRRTFSKRQRDEILKIARSVQNRRSKLGLSQVALDQECAFTVRTVDRVERQVVDHRCFMPDDEKVATVLKALDRLEKEPKKAVSKPVGVRRAILQSRKPREEERDRSPLKLFANLIRCPDHDCWMTQSGCESLRTRDPVCRSLRSGKGCRGVKHRKLEKKTIEVEYTPPSQGDLMPPRRYRKTEE